MPRALDEWRAIPFPARERILRALRSTLATDGIMAALSPSPDELARAGMEGVDRPKIARDDRAALDVARRVLEDA